MEKNSFLAGAPHIRGRLTSKRITQYLFLALLPSAVFGVWNFGIHAAVIVLCSILSALATELLYKKLDKQELRIENAQSALAGLLLACCLPPSVSWYVAVIGGALCALLTQVSRRIFKRTVVSPVILTRLFLMLAFKEQMSTYLFDGLTMATPLMALKNEEAVSTLNMIFGRTGGCIGETSVILLCAGAIFLLLLGVIDFRVSGMYLFSFAAFLAVFGGKGLSSYFLTAQLAGGGYMLALWFIAPDYSTIPITKAGRWLYGILLGVLTGIFRLYGSSAENLCYVMLIANLCVPLIEKITVRRPFGVEKSRL